ncbi:hypothetical protein BCR42DRAFT_432347 [Absidia repens]|uniref:Uncharacterized protein n=1 Tax=Absidia repens TaxID=90262 RepID=A0A1X2IYT8_9FUNG|nr:hypothetical protein BCR42DRAFT_432347 [Absidia repens]
MKQSITLPSISSVLNNNNENDHSGPHYIKLPALSNQYSHNHNHSHKHDMYEGIFLPTSPVSLSSLSPIQQYDNNHHSFTSNTPPSPLIPLAPGRSLSSSLPHTIKETAITENGDSSPLTHPSLFPVIFAPPLKFSTPYKTEDKAKTSLSSSSTKFVPTSELQIIQSSSSDGTIKKRRRGRPPVYTEYHGQQSSGTKNNHDRTFRSPTIWEISSTSKPAASPSCAMSTFSSITLEPELPPPRKKRGRNPKHSIQGNSCFLWKDIPIARKKKIRPLLGQK